MLPPFSCLPLTREVAFSSENDGGRENTRRDRHPCLSVILLSNYLRTHGDVRPYAIAFCTFHFALISVPA